MFFKMFKKDLTNSPHVMFSLYHTNVFKEEKKRFSNIFKMSLI